MKGKAVTELRPTHSPVGASGAERWMNCPGSIAMLKNLNLPPSDESDFAAEGTAAHEAAAKCIRDDLEPWQIVGEKFYKDIPCTVEMADAIETYVSFVRPLKNTFGTWWCEYAFCDPDVHKDFYGTVDFGSIDEGTINVVDFKYGAGITVEVVENPQLMYYAYGFYLFRPDARRVRLSIVQPRAFHQDGKIRTWEISAEELAQWGEQKLIPAILAAQIDETFDAGPWCRFCPAKLVCPLLDGIYKASASFDPKRYGDMSDDALGRDYTLIQAIKFRIKAIEDEVMKRSMLGRQITGTKVVNKKADRVWKSEAEARLREALGAEAFTAPTLKTPPKIEELGGPARELVKELAYTPHTGYTIARADDPRPAVKVQTDQDAFAKSNQETVNG